MPREGSATGGSCSSRRRSTCATSIPGYDVAVTVSSSLRTLTEVWRGDLGWSAALRSGSLDVQGTEAMRRAVPDWFTLSTFAGVPRPEGRLVAGAAR